MANTTIKLKSNTTSGAVPAAGSLVVGELAINPTDRLLFTKAANGTVVTVPNVSGGGTPGGSNTHVQFNDSGAFGGANDFSFDKTTDQLRIGNTTVTTTPSVYLANSTSNTKITVPSAAIYAATNYFLHANGSWVQVTGGGGGTPGGSNTHLQFNDSGSFGGQANLVWDKANSVVVVGGGSAVATEAIKVNKGANSYIQLNLQNPNTGTQSSSDLVITADVGTDTSDYIDLGINGSNYSNASYTIAGVKDGYLYASNGNLTIGTATAKDVIFHANGTLANNEVMRLKSDGDLVMYQNTMVFDTANQSLTLGNSSTTTANVQITPSTIIVQNSTFDTTVDTGGLLLTGWADVLPATPASDLRIFNDIAGGRNMLSQLGPSGLKVNFQPSIARNRVSFITIIDNGAANSSPTMTQIGTSLANTGALTARPLATGSVFTATKRIGLAGNTTAGTSFILREPRATYFLGNAAGQGGFFIVIRFGISVVAAQGRAFVGLKSGTTALTNANPSAQTNIIGIGFDSAQTTLRIMCANSTAANTVDLGSGFPSNSGNTALYEWLCFAPPNSTTVKWQVNRLDVANSISGTYNATNLPAVNTLMALQVQINNGSTAGAAGLDLASIYVETDN